VAGRYLPGFQDINYQLSQNENYQLSQNEDKTGAISSTTLTDFLNYFDSSIQFESVFFEPLPLSEKPLPVAINTTPLTKGLFD